jgi:hypothetical protein
MTRDYNFEYRKRSMVKKQFLCMVENEKAMNFLEYLKRNNLTYSKWVNTHIENELKSIE